MRENDKKSQLQERATLAAKSYQQLARTFSSYVTDRKEENRTLQYMIETVCEGCPRSTHCWEDRREVCEDAFSYVASYAEKTGQVGKEILPEFFRDCFAEEIIAKEWNRVLSIERMKSAAYRQMMEGREALIRQLEETANCFRHICEEDETEQEMSEEKKRELSQYLRRYHVRVKQILLCAVRGKGREWTITLGCTAKKGISVRLLEGILSEWFGVSVKEKRQKCRILSGGEEVLVFREEPAYIALTGIARSVKRAQEVSGDSFSFFHENEGVMSMILSDGMGSGEAASKESETVLELLEQMLAAGFLEETAIRLINSVLALRMEPRSFATLDISRINLYLGTCEFIKIGGAATYIKRGNRLEKMETRTLPIGMLQQVEYDALRKKLYDGDYIIMVSDGVLETVPEEEREAFLAAVIGEDAEQKPQVMAGRILGASLRMQGYEPKDDMTVLVCGIFGRKS